MKSNLAQEAYDELFPNYPEYRSIEVTYSAKFKSLNANVKYDFNKLIFCLSRDWLEYSDDLKKGLMQHLLLKVFSRRRYEKTMELDLYEKFIKNLGKYTKVEVADEELKRSFDRINKEYFIGLMDQPNLEWGSSTFHKLGHYEYASNLIVISDIFKGDIELLDYVMYHELLHKKHGYKTTKTGRSIHHSREFKEEEKKYKIPDIEKKLSWFIRKKKIKNAFRLF